MEVEDSIVADGKKIIIADFVLADEARYYSKRPGLYVGYQPDDTFQIFCAYFPDLCSTPEWVRSRATEVAGIYPSNALIDEMKKAGFEATVRMTSPMVIYFKRP